MTGFPVAAVAVPASTHENRASELMLKHLISHGNGLTGVPSRSPPDHPPSGAAQDAAEAEYWVWSSGCCS